MQGVLAVLSVILFVGPLPLLAQDAMLPRETHRFYIPASAFYSTDLPTLRRASSLSPAMRAVPPAPFPSTDDPWLGRDKMQHLAFSFLLTVGSQYVLVNKGDYTETRALPLSVTATAAIGVAKELYDRQKPRGVFSTRDLVADGVGILLAVGLILW
ncbi:MAG: hypothetical protein RhofKO_00630 [Rhodothermales bacterium]